MVGKRISGRDNTGDALTYTVLTQPANGLLSGTAPNLTYQPATNYTGADSFTFMVSDGVWDATNTVSITVVQWQGWTNIAGGDWSNAASWAGGASPAVGGGADYLLVFSTNVYSGNSTNNLSGTFQLNRLIFDSNLPAVTLFSNALAFTNHAITAPLLIQSGAHAHAFSNAVTLAARTTFGGSGAGKVTLVELAFVLVDLRSREVLLQETYREERAAEGSDAAQLVRAYDAALSAVLARLVADAGAPP